MGGYKETGKVKKSLTKNTIFYLIYNLLNVLFPLATGIYIARVMTPNTVGTVAYVQNIVQYFVILSFLGIPTYGMREVAKVRNRKEDLNKLFTELFTINLVSTVVFYSVYLVMIFSIPEFYSNIILYMISGLSICLNALNISWLFEGEEEFSFISIRNVIVKLFTFIFLLLFVKNDKDIYAYCLVSVIGTGGNYILNMLYYPRFAHFKFRGLDFKKHLKPILSLVVVNLAIEIYSLVDVTMIGWLGDKTDVALYSYASKIQKILLQVINTFTMVLVPRISLLYSENKIKEFNQLLSKTLNLIFLLAVPMIIGMWFVADDAIVFLYGVNYLESGNILRILVCMVLVSPIGYLLGSRVCLVTNNEQKMMFTVILGAIINVIANYCLISKYGPIGAAFASVLSEIVVMIIYVCFGSKYFTLNYNIRNYFAIILSSLLMALYLWIFPLENKSIFIKLFLKISGSIVVYFSILYLLKEENVSELLNKYKTRRRI